MLIKSETNVDNWNLNILFKNSKLPRNNSLVIGVIQVWLNEIPHLFKYYYDKEFFCSGNCRLKISVEIDAINSIIWFNLLNNLKMSFKIKILHIQMYKTHINASRTHSLSPMETHMPNCRVPDSIHCRTMSRYRGSNMCRGQAIPG